MNRQQRRHAAKHHRGPQPTGALVVRKGRVTLAGRMPGLGIELMKGYYARKAGQWREIHDDIRKEGEEADAAREAREEAVDASDDG